jgi:hypothetical protein
MSEVREPACVRHDATQAVHSVPASGIADIGDYSPQYQSIVVVVVLGGVPDDDR